jgi:PAS domain S-box-containing protein
MVEGRDRAGEGLSFSAEAERLLADVIEFLPDATFVIDMEKRVVAWNRACVALTGVKKESLLGQGDHAYAEPFYGERRPILIDLLGLEQGEIDAKYSFVRRKGDVIYAETFIPRLRNGQGAFLWGEASWLFDRHGNRCGAVECIRDVTEQRQAEAELRQREATIQSVFRAAPVGICIMKDRRYQSVNRYWCEEFGYTEESVLGRETRGLYESEEEWQRVGREIYASLAERGQSSTRTRLRRRDGKIRDVILTAALVHPGDAEGGTVVIIHDITELEEAERALRFRNVVLSTQQETSMDGILTVDAQGMIVSFNRKFSDMWRIDPGILEAGSDSRALDWALTQVKDPDGFIHLVRELYAHPERSSQDEIAMADGRTFERHSAPMIAEDSRYFGRVWYFRDITQRKLAEIARDQAEAQLRQSQKMEAIGSLAAGVAHDFNNLLSVIMAATDLAMGQVRPGDPMMSELREVQNAAGCAAALTRQLLAFGRKQMMRPVPLDLNVVSRSLETMLRRILGEDIEMVFRLAPDLDLVRADANQIEQVLMNLVVNARDAMPEGGLLTIETHNVRIEDAGALGPDGPKPGQYIQLTVSDTGCGMDEHVRSRLFEPFFTTKRKGKGTGLGLSTVYGIVRQSGGDISVLSEPGKGTTFKILLPREAATPAVGPKTTATAPAPVSGTETILVVEDELALRTILQRALTAAGYTVLLASNADEALATCARHAGTIQLLLTDVVMPGMGGPALVREIARISPALPVLFMSGYADNMLDQSVLPDLDVHFLAKPFTFAEVSRKVREALDGRRR